MIRIWKDMARILFTWELGEGVGHLLPLKPVLEALVADGHELLVAAVDLRSARSALAHLTDTFVQAPRVVDRRYPLGRPAEGVADLLSMNGYSDPPSLEGRHHAWRQLAMLLKPDMVLAEHSPGALLMARALGIPAIHAGTGFTLPPETSPILYPGFASGANPQRERELLERFNALLAMDGGKPLQQLSDLFNQVADRFLLTFAELDQLGPRDEVPYLGVEVPGGGETPVWPAGKTRVFAYLKPFPAMDAFLQAVRELGVSMVMLPDRVDPALLKRHESPGIRFATRRQAMPLVLKQADLLVSNGNHGTAAAGLLGGVPMLAFPLHQEQECCARRLADSGLGAALLRNRPEKVKPLLEQLLNNDAQKRVSRDRAARYRDFDYRNSVSVMVQSVEAML
jgi:UDP:flavonoid glycosyltransferase YjiC (YdhE family)